MNTKINNISFQANLVTTMHGRNEIMKDVAKRFAEKTRNFEGTFEITRARGKNPEAIIANYQEKKLVYLIRNYADLMGENLSNKSLESVEDITNSYVGIFKTLLTRSVYEKTLKKLSKNKEKTVSAMRANESSLTKAIMRDKDASRSMYLDMIEKNKAKISKIEKAIEEMKMRYSTMLNNIAGKDLRTQECVNKMM